MSIFRPTHGFNAGEPPQDLKPGETPRSQNFVIDGDFLTPRSGLSQLGGFSLGGAALGTFEAFDVTGRVHGFAVSSRTAAHLDPDIASWSTLSYVRGSTLAEDDAPSGTSIDYWQSAFLYDPAVDENVVVFTNDDNFPKFAALATPIATYSDFTHAFSQLSQAQAVTAFNDRLVWFNVERTDDGRLPQRVIWSQRGDPREYDIAQGAGFTDLLDMRGRGQRLVADGDTMLLFSEEEIWRARPRFDAFVFDFFPLSKQLGCPYPETIARTPMGVAFVSRDLEVYLVSGTDIQPLGPRQPGEPSRVRRHLSRIVNRPERMWGVYNPLDRRYELHYPTADSGSGYPDRALYLFLDRFSWLEQAFEHELSIGESIVDPGEGVTWDSLDQPWDTVDATWDGIGSGASTRRNFVFGSGGTSYRFRSDQTTDDGESIDARWRSHALAGRRPFRYDQLFEVHAEYEADSDSSLGVHLTNDHGSTFESAFTRTISASSISNAFYPVNVTGRAPSFELRSSDGGQPRIARFEAFIRDSGRWAGGG